MREEAVHSPDQKVETLLDTMMDSTPEEEVAREEVVLPVEATALLAVVMPSILKPEDHRNLSYYDL